MKPEYIKRIQGRDFVLYEGLLDEAHQNGLKNIDTALEQVPTPDNGNVAIVSAVVTMGDERTFSGLGDASPDNVGKNIAPHIIRMAETRAKARALRDALNIGATALEELGNPDGLPEEEAQAVAEQAVRQARSSEAGNVEPLRGRAEGTPKQAATPKQLNYLLPLIDEHYEGGHKEFVAKVGLPERLTKGAASDWIGRLSGKAQ